MPAKPTKVQSILRTQWGLESQNSFSEGRTLVMTAPFVSMTMYKEPSGAELTKKMCAMVPGPLEDELAEVKIA